nr:MAG TPA: hypothetical protein [Bacteriophage sp.]
MQIICRICKMKTQHTRFIKEEIYNGNSRY